MCAARKPKDAHGEVLEFQVDTKTRDAIAASGLDPRNHEYWEVHAAADGNKGWRSWRGKPETNPVERYQPGSSTFWCANCSGFRAWTHVCQRIK